MHPRQKDITGQRFGKLTAVSYIGDRKWACICDCGGTKDVYYSNLVRANTKSCGCLKSWSSSKRATKHGYYHTKAYRCWCSIKKRCTNPDDDAFPSYGGRGILLYEPWISNPKAFCEYIGPAPTNKHSIDRIDNSKGYEPGNIRWATARKQANNKTTNVKFTFQGQQFTSISAFVRWIVPQLGVDESSFHRELSKCFRGS